MHKHWIMLDHLTASSTCFDDGRYSPLVAKFRSRRSCTCRTLNVFAANFRVVLVVVTFFLSFSLWWIWTLLFFFSRNSLGVHVDWDVICSTTTRRVDIVVAFKSSGYCARELDFRCPQCSSPSKMGSTAPRNAWCPWRKNLSLRDVSKPKVSYTSQLQPAHLHRANARIKRKVSWWTLMATPTTLLLSKFLPFPTVIRNPWKGFNLTRGGRFRWHLSIPQRRRGTCVTSRRPSTSVPRTLTGGSLFPSVRATRSDTAAVGLVSFKLGLDSEKRKPTSYPRSLKRETTFGRRNGLHSFHCMSYALYVSRAFRCPPPFCARTFDE